VGTGFPKRSCSNKKIEPDDDSKKSHPALVVQVEKAPLLALDATDRAIGDFFVGRSVQRHPDRKCAGRLVPDDLNGADRLAPGPMSNGLQALLSQRPVAQPDCLRLRHFAAVKVASLLFHAKPAMPSIQSSNK
jgi:hypothetical protein